MKLQKIIYYIYAKYLVKNNQPLLFNEPIEVWLHGSVSPNLYNEFKHYTYKPISCGIKKGDKKQLTNKHLFVIDKIIKLCGNKDATNLSTLIHQELLCQSAWDNNDDWSQNIIKDAIIKKSFTKNFKGIN
ncbi:Panacea domain-containing protein [Candidatus Phytoplasma solani]|uniref:Panacea domain-containing protein n=1 Tax=Candidatus Phytoplasma solani TaxID=69896 RepID=UPI00358F3639